MTIPICHPAEFVAIGWRTTRKRPICPTTPHQRTYHKVSITPRFGVSMAVAANEMFGCDLGNRVRIC